MSTSVHVFRQFESDEWNSLERFSEKDNYTVLSIREISKLKIKVKTVSFFVPGFSMEI